jgi:hypothetical protein
MTYIITTEDRGNGSLQASSIVFSSGKVLMKKDTDYSHLMDTDNFQHKLKNFMTQLQKSFIEQFIDMLKKSQKKSSEYISEVRSLLGQDQDKDAFELLKDGLKFFPDDLVLLSYHGYLYSRVAKKKRKGIRICRDVISTFESRVSVNRDMMYPIFYLNLGRAYLWADKKKEACRAFSIGLKSDRENADIIAEMNKLGKRRKPVLPFLERSNLLNKYTGLFLSKIGILRH